MRKKDDLAIEKIIECAKTEFLEKGFEGASMRRVAENAGYTTGMLYGRFADKGELFKAIVKASAEKLYSYYTEVQENFAALSPETQYKDMHVYVDKRIGKLLAEQNLVLSVIGIIIGVPLGALTLSYLLKVLASEYEMKMAISVVSYLITAALTIGMSLLVSLLVARKNKKIDMVEALKGQE